MPRVFILPLAARAGVGRRRWQREAAGTAVNVQRSTRVRVQFRAREMAVREVWRVAVARCRRNEMPGRCGAKRSPQEEVSAENEEER